MMAIDNIVFFTANDGVHGRELWRSDGTIEGTYLLADAMPGDSDFERERPPLNWNGLLYTGNREPVSGLWHWWVSDGTREGTGVLYDEAGQPAASVSMFDGPYHRDGRVIRENGIYRFQPSGADATAKAAGIGNAKILRAGEEVLITGDLGGRHAVWRYEAGAKKPTLLLDNILSPEIHLRALGGRFFFNADRPGLGNELYMFDPREGEARLVADIRPGPEGGVGRLLFGSLLFQDKAIFTADDGHTGPEPWLSDGTEAGTYTLGDLNPGPEGSRPAEYYAGDTLLYFQAVDAAHGRELWVSDGTPEGTRILKDIWPGPGSSTPYRLAGRGDELFFTAETPEHGGELWYSDGTPEGTRLVSDHWPGSTGSNAGYNKAFAGDTLLVSAEHPVYGEELWRVDESRWTLELVKDIAPPRGPQIYLEPTNLVAAGRLIYFVVNDARHGAELWRTDGTEDGTFLVHDTWPGPVSGNPCEMIGAGGALYYQATTPTMGAELWYSRGLPGETHLIDDIRPGPESSYPHHLTPFNGRIYFAANDGVHGIELRSVLLDSFQIPEQRLSRLEADLHPGPGSSSPREFLVHGDTLYFVADSAPSRPALWRLSGDGTPPQSVEISLTSAAAPQYGLRLLESEGLPAAVVQGIRGIPKIEQLP